MSTDDCKNFIESVCESNGFTKKDKWKRVKKYKEGNLVLRDFQNSNGDTLIISETHDGTLALHQVKKNIALTEGMRSHLTTEKLLVELTKLWIDCQRSDNDVVNELKSGDTGFKNYGFSTDALMAYLEEQDDSLLIEQVKNHKLKPNSELDETYCIVSTIDQTTFGGSGYDEPNFVDDIAPNTIGVLYDKENVNTYLKVNEGISYLHMECGGDWEFPLIFYVYWSETEGRLKGFFPTGEGNVYNTEAKTAYGSEMEKVRIPYNSPEYDKLEEKYEAMREKFEENSDKFYEKAKIIGFKQLKEEIFTEFNR